MNVRGADRVTTARLPKHEGLDIFAPHQAVWHYMGAVEAAVRALLRLPHPTTPTRHGSSPDRVGCGECRDYAGVGLVTVGRGSLPR